MKNIIASDLNKVRTMILDMKISVNAAMDDATGDDLDKLSGAYDKLDDAYDALLDIADILVD